MRRLALLLCALLVLGLSPTATVMAAAPVARPGAPGIGDPYFPLDGNGGYQVSHYDLRINYRPATHRITRGVATIRATARQRLSRFNLDLVGLSVAAITVNGRRATWSRTAHELQVTPRRVLPNGRPFVVRVRYSGRPQLLREGPLGDNGWFETADGAVVAGQPHVAATWFPVNDHPIDKATYRIKIRVPRGVEALSNGRLAAKRDRGRHTTWTWVMDQPMASYLATATTGQFSLRSYRTGGIQVIDAIDPVLYRRSDPKTASPGERAAAALRKEPEILRFLSGVFGRYPFGQAGGIVDNDPGMGFALENQTRPIYSKDFFTGANRGDDDSVVVHELAHQWTGDDLAVRRWRDIWLNEGFASYAEWLWSERQGRGTADEIFADDASLPADDPFWSVVVANPGAANIFDGAVYDRGAMTLHALRRTIGDAAFFRLLKLWTATYRRGNVSTGQFISMAERVSGRQLDAFFRTWVYTGTKPAVLTTAAARARVPLGPRVPHWRSVEAAHR